MCTLACLSGRHSDFTTFNDIPSYRRPSVLCPYKAEIEGQSIRTGVLFTVMLAAQKLKSNFRVLPIEADPGPSLAAFTTAAWLLNDKFAWRALKQQPVAADISLPIHTN